jgi:hypothetical protein
VRTASCAQFNTESVVITTSSLSSGDEDTCTGSGDCDDARDGVEAIIEEVKVEMKVRAAWTFPSAR